MFFIKEVYSSLRFSEEIAHRSDDPITNKCTGNRALVIVYLVVLLVSVIVCVLFGLCIVNSASFLMLDLFYVIPECSS